jgi:hypothetical protein
MNLFTKIVCGGPQRKSRLHDDKGNFVPMRNLLLNAPPALATGLVALTTGVRPAKPWIAYTSIKYLKRFLSRGCRVLEFGSGMSTIWYAQHAGEVCSVEDNEAWYKKVSKLLENRGLKNVQYELHADPAKYCNFKSDDVRGFDLVMIDGSFRSDCIENAVARVKSGGIVYLDNTDKDSGPEGGDMRLAESRLREIASGVGASVVEVVDFAPAQLFVQQALMVQFP